MQLKQAQSAILPQCRTTLYESGKHKFTTTSIYIHILSVSNLYTKYRETSASQTPWLALQLLQVPLTTLRTWYKVYTHLNLWESALVLSLFCENCKITNFSDHFYRFARLIDEYTQMLKKQLLNVYDRPLMGHLNCKFAACYEWRVNRFCPISSLSSLIYSMTALTEWYKA